MANKAWWLNAQSFEFMQIKNKTVEKLADETKITLKTVRGVGLQLLVE